MFDRAAVAADHATASQAGVEILRAGGNAVDAAVAASFTLSVVRPYSCGLGGGGFMVIHLPSDARRKVKGLVTTAIDYRETGPTGLAEDSFEHDDDAFASTHGGKAICVPGTVAGLLHALDRYGTMARDAVLAPAIRAAGSGFAADAHYVHVAAKETIEWMRRHDAAGARFGFLWQRMLRRGDVKVGDRVSLSEQGEALRLIAQHGAAGFYEGDVAREAVAAARGAGGWLTLDDLKSYRVREVEPFRCEFRGRQVLTMPPPSSGGIVLAQVFAMLEARAGDLDAAIRAGHNSPEYIHLVTECCKHAFSDRARWLGDPAFVDVPLKTLLDPTYLAGRAATIDPARTFPPEHYGTGEKLPEAGGTSHLCAVDAMGGVVSCTETINLYFGSCVAVEKYAFFLNNEMDDFQARMGKANAFELKHAARNRPRQGKRPLSSMTPTIVVGGDAMDHRALLIAGGSGGPRIISGTMQSVLNVLLFGMEASAAVEAPRFHHQWLPNTLQLEPALDAPANRAPLGTRGHTTEPKDAIGAVQLLRAARLDGPSPGGWQAASDPRKGGEPAGY